MLDTVVFVRGLINPLSACGRVVFEYAGSYELLVSPETASEYREVLKRSELTRKFREVGSRNQVTVRDSIAEATFVYPTHVPAICRDPEDDKFLAVAKTGGATYVVTEDTDLLVLGSYDEIQICSATAFLRILVQHKA